MEESHDLNHGTLHIKAVSVKDVLAALNIFKKKRKKKKTRLRSNISDEAKGREGKETFFVFPRAFFSKKKM